VFIGLLGTTACRRILCGEVGLVGLENRMGPVGREGVCGSTDSGNVGNMENVNGGRLSEEGSPKPMRILLGSSAAVKASLESRSVDFGESDPSTRLNDMGSLVGLCSLPDNAVLGAVEDSANFLLICVRAPDGANEVGGGTRFTITLIRGRGDRRTGVSTFDGCGKTWPTANPVWESELCSTMSESSCPTSPTVWARSIRVADSTRRSSSGGSTTISEISDC
jgi:hypothetical protein